MQRVTEVPSEPIQIATPKSSGKKMKTSQSRLQRSTDAEKEASLLKLQQSKEVAQSTPEEETRESAEFIIIIIKVLYSMIIL